MVAVRGLSVGLALVVGSWSAFAGERIRPIQKVDPIQKTEPIQKDPVQKIVDEPVQKDPVQKGDECAVERCRTRLIYRPVLDTCRDRRDRRACGCSEEQVAALVTRLECANAVQRVALRVRLAACGYEVETCRPERVRRCRTAVTTCDDTDGK